jgi:hypothetical protein
LNKRVYPSKKRTSCTRQIVDQGISLLPKGSAFGVAWAGSGRSKIYRAVNIRGKIVESTSNICRAVNFTAHFTCTAHLPRRDGATNFSFCGKFWKFAPDLPQRRFTSVR